MHRQICTGALFAELNLQCNDAFLGVFRLDASCRLSILQGALLNHNGLLRFGQLTFQGQHLRLCFAPSFCHRLGICLHICCALLCGPSRLLARALHQLTDDLTDTRIELDVSRAHSHATRLPLI